MVTDIEISEWVHHLDELAVQVVDQMLRETGMVQPPTVHLLAEGLDPPYVGYLTCRPFYRGQDAATAVTALGLLPAALGCSRLVVTWENDDLHIALDLPSRPVSPAVMVVDAHRHGHTLRRHPLRIHLNPPGRAGLPSVTPQWGPTQQDRDATLPGPVAELLDVWRSPRPWTDLELVELYARLETAGYQMRWIRREPNNRQPSWVRLLAPLLE